jgi:hypothetical protein
MGELDDYLDILRSQQHKAQQRKLSLALFGVIGAILTSFAVLDTRGR